MTTRADITFDNLEYTATQYKVHGFLLRRETKKILHNVSGEFKSGHLSVIMGPSGAGKSTLLNLLAGYKFSGRNGTIKINNKDFNKNSEFQELISYIHQHDMLRPKIKVIEYMNMVANLKMGYSVSATNKTSIIADILDSLGMLQCSDTFTNNLSGGQRKRLAIALELLSNPSILFLDEPTSGLDSSSTSKCIQLLKDLANCGKTIICTIHQPSALLYEMFSKLYVLADGQCFYNGSAKSLVPHFAAYGLPCPKYHNPADFLIDVVCGDYGKDIKRSLEKNPRPLQDADSHCDKVPEVCNNVMKFDAKVKIKPPPLYLQAIFMLQRNVLFMKRNNTPFLIRIIFHLLIGLMCGSYYYGLGNNAARAVNNYAYVFAVTMIICQTGVFSGLSSFPTDIMILKREHFNRWYSLSAYMIALYAIEIPIQMLCACLFCPSAYFITDQPSDNNRFWYFMLFVTALTICAQFWGFFIGSFTSRTGSLFIGPVFVCSLSVYGMVWYEHTPIYLQWMYNMSFYRAMFHNILHGIYAMDRPKLWCPEERLICYFSAPKNVLAFGGIHDVNLVENSGLIAGNILLLIVLTYVVVLYRLKKR